MQSKLSIKTQSKSGNHSPQLKDDIGYVSVFVDSSKDYVIVDAFKGEGREYQRREASMISIFQDGKMIWDGPFSNLCDHLRNDL